jgi:hypothetical protein
MATLSSPTVEKLLTETRIMLNQPRRENSRYTDPELTGYFNDAIAQYFLVLNEQSEGQFDKTTTLNLVSGTGTITLPTDFFSLKTLYKRQGDTDVILAYNNEILDDRVNIGQGSSSSYTPSYYFRGNSLVLNPIPGFSETSGLILEYTAFPETILLGGDSITAFISPLFKEMVVMYAVFKAKMKDDLTSGTQTAAPAQKHLGDLYTNFKHQVSDRSKYPTFIKPFNP